MCTALILDLDLAIVLYYNNAVYFKTLKLKLSGMLHLWLHTICDVTVTRPTYRFQPQDGSAALSLCHV